jgi:TRAP-type C4-dicarboxylate transport system permease small subunit
LYLHLHYWGENGESDLSFIARLEGFVARVEGWAAAALIVGGATLGFVAIVLRYLFDIGWPWTEGIVVMLTVWGALLAGAVAIHEQAHLSLDLLVKRLPTRFQKPASVLRNLLTMAFTGILFVLSVNYWLFLIQSGSLSFVTYLPNWVPFSGVPVALLLMTLHSLYQIINDVQKG